MMNNQAHEIPGIFLLCQILIAFPPRKNSFAVMVSFLHILSIVIITKESKRRIVEHMKNTIPLQLIMKLCQQSICFVVLKRTVKCGNDLQHPRRVLAMCNACLVLNIVV